MLSAAYRFHGHRSLSFLFRQGNVTRRKMLSLKYILNSRRPTSRCAVVVGRKVSKSSPVRNRIRRRIYEIVRVHWTELQSGYDMAFFVYDDSVATLEHAELEALVVGLLKDAGILADI
ncbi:MAG TPA: ribonuclease P protein component [Candidatus Saccharimonadales bacterium]|nr:ribonuclease P protein component [Candidatus Saccharimonadales bacterium]